MKGTTTQSITHVPCPCREIIVAEAVAIHTRTPESCLYVGLHSPNPYIEQTNSEYDTIPPTPSQLFLFLITLDT